MTMLQSGEAAAPPAAGVKDTTTQTFVKDVIEESKRQPVLVDFWAEWCGPCKQLAPVLEKVVRATKGKVKLVKMDIDKHPSIPGQLGIQSIPAVFAFVNGQPVDGFLGALPESQVMAFIERVTKDRVGGEEQDLLRFDPVPQDVVQEEIDQLVRPDRLFGTLRRLAFLHRDQFR